MIKPSPRRISGHECIKISIDGDFADLMELNDVDFEKLLDLLEKANEFWIIDIEEISQFVQAAMEDGKYVGGGEHVEDTVKCTPLIDTDFSTREDVKAYLTEWFTQIKA